MIKTDKYGIIFNSLKLSTIDTWNNYTNHKFVQNISRDSTFDSMSSREDVIMMKTRNSFS